MMRLMLVALVVGACGGAQRSAGGDGAQPAPPDTRSEIERRRDAACDRLAPRLTACAIEEARANLAAGKIAQREFDADTSPRVQRTNTERYATACKGTPYSSRQVRVLEVCDREEQQCEPLLSCLTNVRPQPASSAP